MSPTPWLPALVLLGAAGWCVLLAGRPTDWRPRVLAGLLSVVALSHLFSLVTRPEATSLLPTLGAGIAVLLTVALLDRVIARHKTVELDLGTQKAYLEELFESSPEAIALVASDGRVMRTNSAFTKLFGYSSSEIQGQLIDEKLAPPELIDGARAATRKAAAGAKVSFDSVRRRKDGSLVDVSILGAPVKAGGGMAIFAIYRDVTESKRLEKSVQTTQIGVTVTDLEGRITYTNRADAEMHGYEVEELLGKDVSILAGAERRRPLTSGELRNLTSWRRESLNVRRDGRVFPVQLMSDVVWDEAGEPIGLVTTCEDITSRKQTERALQQSLEELDRRVRKRTKALSLATGQLEAEKAERQAMEAQLQQAQKLEEIGQLAGGVAHDFNNTLSIILANGELLKQAMEGAAPEIWALIDDIVAAGRSGAKVVGQLLGFSRQAELDMVPTDLRELVTDCSDMLRRLIREDIAIETIMKGDVGAVLADHAAVQQIVANLLTNARDAMPLGGTIQIKISGAHLDDEYRAVHTWGEVGDYVCLSVSDTGVGMNERTKAQIFEPFFTTKAPGVGTGLGMAMIYGLIKQHHGFVDVSSKLGEGTTVNLFFPVVHEAIETTRFSEQRDSLRGGTETILVAEDEERLLRAARRALEAFGYQVIVAANGAEALALYRAHRSEIDLIISDLVMPELGGRQLYEAVRRVDGAVKFLFASGYTERDTRERDGLGEHVPFLKKPWTLDELACEVRTVLDQEVS